VTGEPSDWQSFGISAGRPGLLTWSQWRGPSRDGRGRRPVWPESLNEQSLIAGWRVPVGPSYSGPIVSEDHVFVTETSDKTTEIVRALDRRTGREVWSSLLARGDQRPLLRQITWRLDPINPGL
jgi:hypothetical protein